MLDHRSEHEHSARMTRAVDRLEDALERRGFLEGVDRAAMTERFVERARPANGKRIVARAWTDDAFRRRLLDDATTAIEVLGYSMRHGMQPHLRLRVVENTARVHNLVVCTLCSCYPIALLGPPPRWYKSTSYRSRAVAEPRAVLADLGLELPEDTEVRVWDSTSDLRYMVLPRRPADTTGWAEEQLAELVPRDALVGAAVATDPSLHQEGDRPEANEGRPDGG
jgi:nitrile hydratase subunit alpha